MTIENKREGFIVIGEVFPLSFISSCAVGIVQHAPEGAEAPSLGQRPR